MHTYDATTSSPGGCNWGHSRDRTRPRFSKWLVAFSLVWVGLLPAQAPTAHAVIGGKPDTTSYWYVVSLAIGNSSCSGTLIDSQWVLTAAHCVADDDGSFDISGAWAKAVDPLTGQALWESRISAATYHPEYADSTLHNDIALLSLASSIPGPYAPMASEEELAAVEAFGIDAIASGFGRTSNYNVYSTSTIPLEVRLPLVAPEACRRTWPYGKNPYFSKFVCTNPTVRSTTCQGDSGGPLFIEVGGARKLVGVTSFGSMLCGYSYTVFARVPSYLDWLSGIMKPSSRPSQPSPVVAFPDLPPLPPSALVPPTVGLPGSSTGPLPEFSTTRLFQLTLESAGRSCLVDIDAPISLRGRSMRIFVDKTKGRPTATRVLDEFGDTRIRVPKTCSNVPYKRIYVQLDDSSIKVRTVL